MPSDNGSEGGGNQQTPECLAKSITDKHRKKKRSRSCCASCNNVGYCSCDCNYCNGLTCPSLNSCTSPEAVNDGQCCTCSDSNCFLSSPEGDGQCCSCFDSNCLSPCGDSPGQCIGRDNSESCNCDSDCCTLDNCGDCSDCGDCGNCGNDEGTAILIVIALLLLPIILIVFTYILISEYCCSSRDDKTAENEDINSPTIVLSGVSVIPDNGIDANVTCSVGKVDETNGGFVDD